MTRTRWLWWKSNGFLNHRTLLLFSCTTARVCLGDFSRSKMSSNLFRHLGTWNCEHPWQDAQPSVAPCSCTSDFVMWRLRIPPVESSMRPRGFRGYPSKHPESFWIPFLICWHSSERSCRFSACWSTNDRFIRQVQRSQEHAVCFPSRFHSGLDAKRDSVTDDFSRFSSVVLAPWTLKCCWPVSTNGKTLSNSTRNVWPTTVPTVVSHSRSHMPFSSDQSAWCATTLPNGNVRFPPLRCSDDSPYGLYSTIVRLGRRLS